LCIRRWNRCEKHRKNKTDGYPHGASSQRRIKNAL